MESVQALCEALQTYEGGLVIVTHDARLIAQTGCDLWVVKQHSGGCATVAPYPSEAGR